VEWPWWGGPDIPVEGILVLSVDHAAQVELIGRVRDSPRDVGWTVPEAKAIDINSVRPDEVVLVDGWLTGLGGSLLCLARPEGIVDGLPNRWCANTGVLMQMPDDDLYDSTGPTGIELQGNAYWDFAADPWPELAQTGNGLPRWGTYALAPRLEGWCADRDAPCWQWDIVARVNANGDITPTPTERFSRTFICAGSEALGDPGITLVDHSGRIAGCSMASADGIPAESIEVSTSSPGNVTVDWTVNKGCPGDEQMVFGSLVENRIGSPAYVLQVGRRSLPGEICNDLGGVRRVLITFSEPVPSYIEAFVAVDGRSVSAVESEDGAQDFELEI
jgi:hypothetical protein